MMEKFNLLLNDVIDVLVDTESYKSNVQDITDKYIAISVPTREGVYVPLSKDSKIDVMYYKDDSAYRFTTFVTGRKKDKINLILLSIPENVRKVQRRQYFRVPLSAYVSYVNLTKYSKSIKKDIKDINIKYIEKDEKLFSKALIMDISGGGVKLSSEKTCSVGDIILLEILLEQKPVFVKGKIVRKEYDEQCRNLCGILYIDMEQNMREKIIKYIFYVMRNIRRKGVKED